MTAPADADARIKAPVFRACIARRPSPSKVEPEPAASRSIAWPPTMPHGPAASATIRIAASLRAASAGSAGSRAISANASVSRASPARIAWPSPKTTWLVGRPRRSVSSSIAGRSSCTRE
jgi:hypothetical protein